MLSILRFPGAKIELAVPTAGTPLLAVLAFTCVVGLLGYRAATKLNVPGAPDEQHWALRDFRDAIYYPVKAFLDGENPYDPVAYRRAYPVGNDFRLYSPHTLLLHLPFGLLPPACAGLAYFALTVALTLVLAYVTLLACGWTPTVTSAFALGAAMLMTRPGHWNLLLGQYTVTVVIGSYLALLHGRKRPWLAGLGLALAAVKPTFGAPLAFLMLWRREVRAVAIGVATSAFLSAGVTAILAHHGGLTGFAAAVARSYEVFAADPMIKPASALFRADAVALAAHLTGSSFGLAVELAITAAVLGLGAAACRSLSRQAGESARRLSASVACVTTVACIYHQSYDALLLTLPAAMLVLSPMRNGIPPAYRRTLLGALLVPAVNYVASGTATDALRIAGPWLVAVASINGLAVLTALLILCRLAFRPSLREAGAPAVSARRAHR